MRLTVFVVLVAAACASVPALADQPGADWISKADLKAQMQRAGYSAIVVGADDGHWEGEAVKDGRIVEFHADSKTGAITKSEPKTED